MPHAVIIAVLGFVPLCMLSDVRSRRIPNPLSVAGVGVGVGLNVHYFGLTGLAMSTTGLVLAVVMLLAPFATGGIGGGDVKMMGALGAMLGPRLILFGLIVGLALGGIIAALHAARRGMLRATVTGFARRIGAALRLGTIEPLRMSAGDGSGITLPYSVPLGLGALAALFGG
jgi:prepilin peptidase CpaA